LGGINNESYIKKILLFSKKWGKYQKNITSAKKKKAKKMVIKTTQTVNEGGVIIKMDDITQKK